jgi:hypothetical protein
MGGFNFKYSRIPNSSYFTLSSAASHEFYPLNVNNEFSNILLDNIEVREGELEIGLIEAYFTPDSSKRRDTIFGNEVNDNRITQTIHYTSDHTVNKITGRVEQFVEHINDEFKKKKVKMVISLLVKDTEEHLVITLNQPRYQLQITKAYAVALGFLKDVNQSGRNEADRPYVQELYDKIDPTQLMNFKIFREEVTFVCKRARRKKRSGSHS